LGYSGALESTHYSGKGLIFISHPGLPTKKKEGMTWMHEILHGLGMQHASPLPWHRFSETDFWKTLNDSTLGVLDESALSNWSFVISTPLRQRLGWPFVEPVIAGKRTFHQIVTDLPKRRTAGMEIKRPSPVQQLSNSIRRRDYRKVKQITERNRGTQYLSARATESGIVSPEFVEFARAGPVASFLVQPNKTIPAAKGARLATSLFQILKGSVDENMRAVEYSYLKIGSPERIRSHADQLTDLIKSKLGQSTVTIQDWIVVNIGGFGIPNAGTLLAKRVAQNLGLPHVVIETGLKADPELIRRYASLSREDRLRLIIHNGMGIKDTENLVGKSVLLIDDAEVTGTILSRAMNLIYEAGVSRIEPYVVTRLVDGDDASYENYINHKALEVDGIQALVSILNNNEAIYTTKTIQYAYELDSDKFNELLSYLEIEAKINLYFYSIEYFASNAPGNIDILADDLKKKLGLELPYSRRLRHIRSEAFFKGAITILKDHNYRISSKSVSEASKRLSDLVLKAYREQRTASIIFYDLHNTLMFDDAYAAIKPLDIQILSNRLNMSENVVLRGINKLRRRLKAKGLSLRQNEITSYFGVDWLDFDRLSVAN
jgi:hypothetical protein